ncbi:MAG: cupin domain-containing protein [Pseudomonadota bacterium]
MDWDALRRIVTHDENGRSRILIDGAAAKLFAVEETGLAEIWSAGLSADKILDASDQLSIEDVRLEPAPGAVKVRWFTVAPEADGRTREEKESQAAMAFSAIGAEHCRIDTEKHPAMHKTDSLDVIVLVRGEVELVLDDAGATALKPGDVVIQRATNHAWVNKTAETALLVAILMNGTTS